MATYTINKVKSPEGDIYNLQDASALHNIPVATTENVGGVKAGGTGISIDANGVISSTAPGQMVWLGTSPTAESTAEKAVTCSGFTLQEGEIIGVIFQYGNTAAVPKLNVNSTGAKNIYIGASLVNGTTNVLKWSSYTLAYFVYDGTVFRYITSVASSTTNQPRGSNTWYGTSSTPASTTAKISTIANYVLTKGSVVCITFSTANTVDAPTLNVNNTGAKEVYYNNAVTSSSNKLTWDAGETVTFIYSGSYYYFVTKSKQQSGGITSESDPVYSASPAAGITASDITNWNSKGTGTVTSVRVRGTAPISSSVSTAQTGSLDTTISISDATTSASGAMSAADKTKLDALPSSISGTAPIDVTDGVVSISAATTSAAGSMSADDKTKLNKLEFGTSTYETSKLYVYRYAANAGADSGAGQLNISKAGTTDFTKLEIYNDHLFLSTRDSGTTHSGIIYSAASSDSNALARYDTSSTPASYNIGYMTGQDKEKLDKVIINIDNNVTLLTNGIKSNAVSSGDQSWRLFLGDYVSTQNYGVNSKTIMGLRGDNAVGDGLMFASYGTDGALDGKVAIGSTGIRSRDSSGSVAWDIDVPISAVELGHVTGTADSLSLWRGWDNATFGDYMGIGTQNADGTDGFRMYFGQNAWRFRTYVGTTGGADAWWMFPSRIPQFNNNTSTTVSSVTSTYTYTGATSSSGTAYWYYYMDDSHIYGWVRLNCGNATSSTSKSTVLNLPTAFTSGITISTGANDGGRFFITPFGTNGGTVDRMWVNAYTATNVTVNCTVASANTTAIPMNMMFFFNYTKNS